MSVYGDSYGTYFAQAFAVRHPARVRAVVLDAAFARRRLRPVGPHDDRRDARGVDAALRALRTARAATRSPTSGGSRCGSSAAR